MIQNKDTINIKDSILNKDSCLQIKNIHLEKKILSIKEIKMINIQKIKTILIRITIIQQIKLTILIIILVEESIQPRMNLVQLKCPTGMEDLYH